MIRYIMIIMICVLLVKVAYAYDETETKVDEAIKEMNKLNAEYEKNTNILNKYYELLDNAASLAMENNYGKAIYIYTEAIKLKPELSAAYYERGVLYEKMSKKSLARNDYKAALKANNVEISNRLNAIFYLERAKIYYKLKNKIEAEINVNIALEKGMERAIYLKNRLQLDGLREKKWKIYWDYDYCQIYYIVYPSNYKTKKIAIREEFYNSNFRNNMLSEYKSVVPEYEDVFYTITILNMTCSDRTVSIENKTMYSQEGRELHYITGDPKGYVTIIPGTIYDGICDKVCNNNGRKKRKLVN